MGFQKKNSTSASTEKYFIDPRTGAAKKMRNLIKNLNYMNNHRKTTTKNLTILLYFKGSCSEQFKTLMKEGVSA